MMVMMAAVGVGMVYFLWRKKVLALPARYGASWATLLKRMKYRGGRKQRSASRKVLRATRLVKP